VVDAVGRPISPELVWIYQHAPTDVLLRHMQRYQVHQRGDGTIEVRVQVSSPLPADVGPKLIASYERLVVGRRAELRVMEDLGEDRPGKFRLVSSVLAGPDGR
jgi:hypothetical protein